METVGEADRFRLLIDQIKVCSSNSTAELIALNRTGTKLTEQELATKQVKHRLCIVGICCDSLVESANRVQQVMGSNRRKGIRLFLLLSSNHVCC